MIWDMFRNSLQPPDESPVPALLSHYAAVVIHAHQVRLDLPDVTQRLRVAPARNLGSHSLDIQPGLRVERSRAGHVLRPQQGPAAGLLALGALAFGAYPIVSHTADYRDILLPLRKKTRRRFRWFHLKKSL